MATDLILAYLHFISIIIAAACLAAELALFRPDMSVSAARMLGRIDAGFGTSALAILVTGLLRVFYGLKGSAFYLSNAYFWALVAGFALIALFSLPPTVLFLRWRPALRSGTAPNVPSGTFSSIRTLMIAEVLLFLLMPLLAGLMSRGY